MAMATRQTAVSEANRRARGPRRERSERRGEGYPEEPVHLPADAVTSDRRDQPSPVTGGRRRAGRLHRRQAGA